MLTSLALIFLLGLILGSLFQKLKLPSLLGMLICGMILGPYALNLLDEKILTISPELRRLALVIILTRAGLSLNINDLRKVGRPAALMCFLPASLEITGFILLAPILLPITWVEAAIMGCVVAAVSPAVIIPRILKIKEEGYGVKKGIPSLLLTGASVDDIYVVVLFGAFLSLGTGKQLSAGSFLQIPIAILVGLMIGIVTGILLTKLFRLVHMRDSVKVLILLSTSFLLIELETRLGSKLPMSGLLAIMSMSATFNHTYDTLAKRLSVKFNQLWVAAEILAFVLVGTTVDTKYAVTAGGLIIVVIILGLLCRMLGVAVCFIRTHLTGKERAFCMIAYTPKASVQAAIGAVPLSMGLACGNQVLIAAVLSIILTAPLGAIAMDMTYRKLLEKDVY